MTNSIDPQFDTNSNWRLPPQVLIGGSSQPKNSTPFEEKRKMLVNQLRRTEVEEIK